MKTEDEPADEPNRPNLAHQCRCDHRRAMFNLYLLSTFSLS